MIRLVSTTGWAKLVKNEHAPLRLERLQREKEYIESLGIARDYNSSFESVTGISLSELADSCERFLRDTKSMWDDTLRGALRASFGIKPSEARRADALALFRASEYDDTVGRSGGAIPRREALLQRQDQRIAERRQPADRECQDAAHQKPPASPRKARAHQRRAQERKHDEEIGRDGEKTENF